MSKIFEQEKVWLDKSKYDEVECVNYEKLSKKQENNDIEVVAIDCEMVGINHDGREDMLARVSIINSKGEIIYDKFVKPTTKVTDYRTPVSGIRPEDIEHGEIFTKVKQEVLRVLKNKIVICHSPKKDLKVLKISHPRCMIRDTSTYSNFMQFTEGRKPSLKQLTLHFLGASIQEGQHRSVQAAKAALQLYMIFRDDWESQINLKNNAVIQEKENNDIEVLAIDCEKIGVQQGNTHGNMLARVSIVNSKGEIIYDKFVKNTAKVTDYRTSLSGIQPKDILYGVGISKVKKQVARILKNKLLVGHSLKNNFRMLEISHPEHMLRDISTCSTFTILTKNQKPSLKRLARYYFETVLPDGEHRSVENAKAALRLYMLVRNDWEKRLKKKRKNSSRKK
ncbi:RNA exonuclease 4-like isoform X2 [Metopolophium dirhodum]|uniref:RNA exonuclease 4-like isoform X2 n=1 Tax=Metopolophium dirhodum TaxID=44670 RepID=UPI00298FA688|nr:RNA exonuclease 4-like isoform X2 [Metopolophium dirhodum]